MASEYVVQAHGPSADGDPGAAVPESMEVGAFDSRVVDIVRELANYNVLTDVFDPWVDFEEARRKCGFTPIAERQPGEYDAIVLAVAHDQFRVMADVRL